MSTDRSRWVIGTLVVSLALNLLVAGAVIGRSVFDPGLQGPLPPNLGWLVRSASEDKRKIISGQMRENFGRMRSLRVDMRNAQRDFNRIASSDDLDEAALRNVLKRLREANLAYQMAMHDEMLSVISSLDGPARKQAIRYLQSRERDGGRGDRRRRGPPGRERPEMRPGPDQPAEMSPTQPAGDLPPPG